MGNQQGKSKGDSKSAKGDSKPNSQYQATSSSEVPSLPSIPRPNDPATVESMFESMMDDMGFNAAVKATMRTFDLEKKWLVIIQNKRNEATHDEDEAAEDAKNWSKRLLDEKQYTSKELFRQLRPVFNSSNRSWIEQFVQYGGLSNLLKAGSSLLYDHNDLSGDILYPCLMCIDSLMNNESGIDAFLENDEAVLHITTWFACEAPEIQNLLLKLLTVAALLGYHQNILEGFENYRNLANSRHTQLFPVVKALNDSIRRKDLVLCKNIMIFINALINHTDALEARVAIRRGFIDLEILDQFETLSKAAKWFKLKDEGRNQLCKELKDQCQIFENLRLDDQQEVCIGEIDLSDASAVFGLLKTVCLQNGSMPYLLELLQRILLIPNDSMGREMWEYISKSVEQIVLANDGTVVTFAQLKSTFFGMGDASTRYQSKIRELESALNALETEKAQLQGKDTDYQKQLREALEQVNELRKHVIELESGGYKPVAPTKAVPVLPGDGLPPVVPVAPPPPAPPAPPPPPAPGLAPPMAPGVPVPVKNAIPPGMKAKEKIQLDVKMRQFHWNKLQNGQIEGTVWQQLDDSKVKLDLNDLKCVFGESKENDEVQVKTTVKKKPERQLIKLIDEKRSYNIQLILSRFKVSPVSIRDAIIAMDEKTIRGERILQLIKCAPTEEEIQQVTSFEGDKSKLAGVEQLFLAVSDIPDLENRLELWKYKQQFDELFSELRSKLDTVISITLSMRTAKKFKQLLELILALGNVLNGGTSKGQAYGFKLTSLKSLASTKSMDKSKTLLQYIVETTNTKYPHIRGFIEELKDVGEATRIEQQPFVSEVNVFTGKLDLIEKTLKGFKNVVEKDQFPHVMSKFVNKHSADVRKLKNDLKEGESSFHKLIEYFGCKKGEYEWHEFFDIFNNFMEQWIRTETEIEEMKRKEAMEQKKKEAMEMKRMAKLEISQRDGKTKNVADSLFNNYATANPEEVMERIRERRAKRKMQKNFSPEN